jgi:hypothetical protein
MQVFGSQDFYAWLRHALHSTHVFTQSAQDARRSENAIVNILMEHIRQTSIDQHGLVCRSAVVRNERHALA